MPAVYAGVCLRGCRLPHVHQQHHHRFFTTTATVSTTAAVVATTTADVHACLSGYDYGCGSDDCSAPTTTTAASTTSATAAATPATTTPPQCVSGYDYGCGSDDCTTTTEPAPTATTSPATSSAMAASTPATTSTTTAAAPATTATHQCLTGYDYGCGSGVDSCTTAATSTATAAPPATTTSDAAPGCTSTAAPPAATTGDAAPGCCTSPGADIVIALDRSVSVGETAWYTCYLPFMKTLIELINPREDGTDAVRVAIVVFAANAEGSGQQVPKRIGDLSGNAAVFLDLTADKAKALKLVQDAINDPRCVHSTSSTTKHTGAGTPGQGDGPVAGSANPLAWPCGGWAWTPTWLAVRLADELLFPGAGAGRGNTKKMLLLVTDGAPSNTNQGKHSRSSYLTLKFARDLKARMANDPVGGAVVGTGIDGGDSKLTNLGTPCHPFCNEGGYGLFLGNTADTSPVSTHNAARYSGKVTIGADPTGKVEHAVAQSTASRVPSVPCFTGVPFNLCPALPWRAASPPLPHSLAKARCANLANACADGHGHDPDHGHDPGHDHGHAA